MDLSKLTYSKGDSGKTPLKPVPKTAIESILNMWEEKKHGDEWWKSRVLKNKLWI